MALTGQAWVGLSCWGLWSGQARFHAWIQADNPDHFRVPPPDYNPMGTATRCRDKSCRRDSHWIVGEGFYIPLPNLNLYAELRGVKVEVTTGLAR